MLENVLTLFIGIFLALQMDSLSAWLCRKWYDQYITPHCEMCNREAAGKFMADGKEIDLCPPCMDEALRGSVTEAFRQVQDDFEAGTDF